MPRIQFNVQGKERQVDKNQENKFQQSERSWGRCSNSQLEQAFAEGFVTKIRLEESVEWESNEKSRAWFGI